LEGNRSIGRPLQLLGLFLAEARSRRLRAKCYIIKALLNTLICHVRQTAPFEGNRNIGHPLQLVGVSLAEARAPCARERP
jgi:hypothetical protein